MYSHFILFLEKLGCFKATAEPAGDSVSNNTRTSLWYASY